MHGKNDQALLVLHYRRRRRSPDPAPHGGVNATRRERARATARTASAVTSGVCLFRTAGAGL